MPVTPATTGSALVPQAGTGVTAVSVPEAMDAERRKELLSGLSGREKVAILCMALGAEDASALMQHLTADEGEELAYQITQNDRVPSEVVEAVLAEFLDTSMVANNLATGGVEFARAVLEKSFGSAKASETLRKVQSQLADTAGLTKLRNADPAQLVSTLRGEHPQTIALVLAHLQPTQTAQLLKEFPSELGGEVMYRIGRMEKVLPEMLQLVERALSTETDLTLGRGLSQSGGPEAVAEVLNFVPGSLEKDILERISGKDEELCEQIKNLMFVFEDISSLDDKSLQRVLREVDAKMLALALKSASADFVARMRSCMSARGAQALDDEVALLGAVRVRDVEAAQADMISLVRKLEAAGEVMISSGDAEDQLIA